MHARQVRSGPYTQPPVDPGAIAVGGTDTLIDSFKAVYRDAAFYSTGRDWPDYEPAYRLGHDAFGRWPLARFQDLEDRLQADWDVARGASRLAWVEARGAVEHAWAHTRALAPHPCVAGDAPGLDEQPWKSDIKDPQ